MKSKFKQGIGILMLFVVCGCADLNTTAFNTTKLLADTGTASVHSFNVYYTNAIVGATAEQVAALDQRKVQVYDASRKLGAVLAVAEEARLAYATNKTPATTAVLQQSLANVSANSGNVTSVVANALSPAPVTFIPLTK